MSRQSLYRFRVSRLLHGRVVSRLECGHGHRGGSCARPDERRDEIIEVLVDLFHGLLPGDPEAFRRKFRKMAASPFAFYRGSAALFYADMSRDTEEPADPRAARVWIQGDLHAENFGTYLNAAGRLVFDVNDFDEAYIGHFGWDLRRLATSLALIGHAKAFSDAEIELIVAECGRGYADRVHALAAGADIAEVALTLDTTEGPMHAALESARVATRADLLDSLSMVEGCERRLRRSQTARDIDSATMAEVRSAFDDYLTTLPDLEGRDPSALQIQDVVAASGFGIGSAGQPAFTLLLAGPTDALETDVVISIKQATVCAPSRIVRDEHINDYFEHHGHRTVISQRALQAHADPWLGFTVLRAVGQVVKELSPYERDLDWGELNDVEEVARVSVELGRAVAKIHSVADAHAEHSLVPFPAEQAIASSIGADRQRFAAELADFALAYSAVVRNDHGLFVDAFRNHQIADL